MLFEKIKEYLTELDEDGLIQLSINGPSVNWNVLEKLDDYLMITRTYQKLFILDAVTNIYCTELSKLPFVVLVRILMKS